MFCLVVARMAQQKTDNSGDGGAPFRRGPEPWQRALELAELEGMQPSLTLSVTPIWRDRMSAVGSLLLLGWMVEGGVRSYTGHL